MNSYATHLIMKLDEKVIFGSIKRDFLLVSSKLMKKFTKDY
jgi:hypothetical protein